MVSRRSARRLVGLGLVVAGGILVVTLCSMRFGPASDAVAPNAHQWEQMPKPELFDFCRSRGGTSCDLGRQRMIPVEAGSSGAPTQDLWGTGFMWSCDPDAVWVLVSAGADHQFGTRDDARFRCDSLPPGSGG